MESNACEKERGEGVGYAVCGTVPHMCVADMKISAENTKLHFHFCVLRSEVWVCECVCLCVLHQNKDLHIHGRHQWRRMTKCGARIVLCAVPIPNEILM